jgi:hypothetical protein
MAAGLGFKTFNTGDVLTAADTNGYLMQGVLVFADAAARNAAITSPQEGQCCYLKDTDVIQSYSGSAWVTKSAGGSSGAVVQVVTATTTSSTSSTSTSFVDTNLTATITPTSASNKVLVFGVMPTGFYGSGSVYYGIGIRILRGSTNINTSEPGEAFSIQCNSLGSNFSNFTRSSFNYTDSPATTSATTYKLQISSASPGTILANYHDVGSIILMEVTP